MNHIAMADLQIEAADPAAALLRIGPVAVGARAKWPNYPVRFGLNSYHVARLGAMLNDRSLAADTPDEAAGWAPLHAWRSLGQLRAPEALGPLMDFLANMTEDDDAAVAELPVVFGLIGPDAVAPMAAFLAWGAPTMWQGDAAVTALTEIAARHPECRAACVDAATASLRRKDHVDPFLNGCTVSALLDLGAREVIDVIREAFAREAIDVTVAGDVEDVEIEFGLRERRSAPRRRYGALPAAWTMPRDAAGRCAGLMEP
jgi:hypothetical protein